MIAAMAAMAEGANASIGALARVIAAATPTTPMSATRTRPHGGRRASSTPAAPATATSTIAMPTSSAALSAVPNSAIAASFAHGGARSIRNDPTTTNGLDAGREDRRREFADADAEDDGCHARRSGQHPPPRAAARLGHAHSVGSAPACALGARRASCDAIGRGRSDADPPRGNVAE